MSKSLSRTAIGVVLVGGVLLARLVNHQATVFGFYRSGDASTAVAENDLIYISDTIACEDIHYHSRSNTLFAACEDSLQARFDWFPAAGHTDHPESAGTGSIHVIDAEVSSSGSCYLQRHADIHRRKSRSVYYSTTSKVLLSHMVSMSFRTQSTMMLSTSLR